MKDRSLRAFIDATRRHSTIKEDVIIYDIEIYSEALPKPRIVHISGTNRSFDQIHNEIISYVSIVFSTLYKHRIKREDVEVVINDFIS